MDKYQIKNDLIKGIINGEYTLAQVRDRILKIEAEYGEEFFDDDDFPKEEMPWNRETLKKLETASLVGTCSKLFILHLAEVSEYVHNKERNDEDSKKKNIRLRVLVVSVIVVILILVVLLCNIQANAAEETLESQAMATQIDTQPIQAVENWMTI